jgi:hypothetical protein
MYSCTYIYYPSPPSPSISLPPPKKEKINFSAGMLSQKTQCNNGKQQKTGVGCKYILYMPATSYIIAIFCISTNLNVSKKLNIVIVHLQAKSIIISYVHQITTSAAEPVKELLKRENRIEECIKGTWQ